MTDVHREIDSGQEAIRLAVKATREAWPKVACASAQLRKNALARMCSSINDHRQRILEANSQDISRAEASGRPDAFVDRLRLTQRRVDEMVASIEAVNRLPDPIGEVLKTWNQEQNLKIQKVRVPIGVVGIIYESRPNVTSDCAALCLKSGNAVVLRGGTESFGSNQAIATAIQEALSGSEIPAESVNLVPIADRSGVDAILQMDDLIDVIIPRGGESLIRKVVETSRIPVIKHAKGVCHIYVDREADLDKAHAITVNAKCQRPGTCNAIETLLVHEAIAADFLPKVAETLTQAGVELRGCGRTQSILKASVKPANEEDWPMEYLALILAVRVVPSVQGAIDHIRRYGSGHSDAIITEDTAVAERFLREVDSAAVYVNASTRFTDGYQFGLGAEMGISTDRLHARGPMGLEELTTYKYVIRGDGQIRS